MLFVSVIAIGLGVLGLILSDRNRALRAKNIELQNTIDKYGI